MRRPGTRRTYDTLLARIRTRVPGVVLRTTFIVGFPGETEADVDALEGFVRDTGFDHVGVFTYSHEEGTRAHALADDVPSRTKRARRTRIMGVQRQIAGARRQAEIGRVVRVLVDGPSAESPLVMAGRVVGQAPDIDSVVILSDCDPALVSPGDFIDARIIAASGYDLVAEPLPRPAPVAIL
jgi:ribosomal protein S12 methylthiotransferase